MFTWLAELVSFFAYIFSSTCARLQNVRIASLLQATVDVKSCSVTLIVSYTLFLSTVPGHYQSIALIPDGTRNIQIKELSGFKNYLGKFKSGCKFIIASLSSIISHSI